MRRLLASLLLSPALAFASAPSDAPNKPVDRPEPSPQRQPKRVDEIDSDLPPIYRGPWGARFGRGVGGCCHEAPDGQVFCHGVRS